MLDIKVIKCPNCGAGISNTKSACDYCGSRIVLSDDGNCRSCDKGIQTKIGDSPGSGDEETRFQRWEAVRQLDDEKKANRLLNSKLDTAEGPGCLIAPAMFSAASICIYADSGKTVGLVISAFLVCLQ